MSARFWSITVKITCPNSIREENFINNVYKKTSTWLTGEYYMNIRPNTFQFEIMSPMMYLFTYWLLLPIEDQ